MSKQASAKNYVLLVDDEVDVLKGYELTLKSRKISNIITCPDSREVIPILEKIPVDVVVLDLMMPGISGEELLEDLNSGLYCETVMANRCQLHVTNAREDNEWNDNPDVKLNMISYLGLPLVWPDGSIFGTICVLDEKPGIIPGIMWTCWSNLKILSNTILKY